MLTATTQIQRRAPSCILRTMDEGSGEDRMPQVGTSHRTTRSDGSLVRRRNVGTGSRRQKPSTPASPVGDAQRQPGREQRTNSCGEVSIPHVLAGQASGRILLSKLWVWTAPTLEGISLTSLGARRRSSECGKRTEADCRARPQADQTLDVDRLRSDVTARVPRKITVPVSTMLAPAAAFSQ